MENIGTYDYGNEYDLLLLGVVLLHLYITGSGKVYRRYFPVL